VNLLERAVGLLQADDLDRLRLLPVLGRALRSEGQMEQAEVTLAEAVALGELGGERAIAADAAVALSDLRFHRAAYTGVGREDVLRQVELAVRTFEELGDEAGLGRALCLGGKLRFWAGDAEAAVIDFERAGRHSRVAGDRAEEAESLQGVVSAMLRGPMAVEEALVKVAVVRPRAEGNLLLLGFVREAEAQLEAMQGDFNTARALLAEDAEDGSGVVRSRQQALRTLPARGYVELAAGNPSAAEPVLRAACEAMEQSGELGYLSSVVPMLVDALYRQGRDGDALAASDRWQVDRLTVKEDADAQAGWRRTRAKVLARRGDHAEALRLGREAVSISAGTDFVEVRADSLADLAEVLEYVGQPEEARRTVQAALQLYLAKGNVAAAARVRSRVGVVPGASQDGAE
jgi:tetratricopeptide (TPR) repeat protein